MPLILLLAAACSTPTDTGKAQGDTGETGDTSGETGDSAADTGVPGWGDVADCADVSTWIGAAEPWTGDTTCFDGATWGMGRVADAALAGVVRSVAGEVLDFQTSYPQGGITVEAWYADDGAGASDTTAVSAGNGSVTLSLPQCEAHLIRTSTPADPEATVPAYLPHSVEPPTGSEAWFSMSATTPGLIQALLGRPWAEGTGMVAGQVLDCAGNPVGNVQVVLYDASCAAPADAGMAYMDGDIPSDEVTHTQAADGIFMALDVPEGDWRAEAWGWDGTGPVGLAGAPLHSVAGAVTVLTLHVGVADGVALPDSCL